MRKLRIIGTVVLGLMLLVAIGNNIYRSFYPTPIKILSENPSIEDIKSVEDKTDYYLRITLTDGKFETYQSVKTDVEIFLKVENLAGKMSEGKNVLITFESENVDLVIVRPKLVDREVDIWNEEFIGLIFQ